MPASNTIIEAMISRRSNRKYIPGEVPREQLEAIVDCGRLAPSAMNRQSWEFVVVTRRERLQQLAALVPNNGPFISDAAACVVVAGDPSNRSLFLDGGAAVENMLLAIHSLNLASCWVQGYQKDYNPQVKELLEIPTELELIALVPIGIPAPGPGRNPAKRSLSEVLHWEQY